MGEKRSIKIEATPKEAKFIQMWRDLEFGEIEKVVIHNGEPTNAFLARTSIRFDV